MTGAQPVRVFGDLAEVASLVGEPLGTTAGRVVEQAHVDAFADLTGDHQWIHVDVDRARASSYGSTIAHGYLTLAMLPSFAAELYRFDVGSSRLNYGVNKVRFPASLPAGGTIRASASFVSVAEIAAGTQVTTRWVVEADGLTKPVCVAESITLVVA